MSIFGWCFCWKHKLLYRKGEECQHCWVAREMKHNDTPCDKCDHVDGNGDYKDCHTCQL